MEPTFITDGECTPIMSTKLGIEHHIDHYKVGRKGMSTIWMLNAIPEYSLKGKHIYIDKYGNPWVKGV
jgi:hypothetical protein